MHAELLIMYASVVLEDNNNSLKYEHMSGVLKTP